MHEGPEELRITPEMVRLVEDWNRAYEVYARAGSARWMHCRRLPRIILKDVVAGIYLSRVTGFVLEPPPDDWAEIMHFSQK